MSPYGASGRRPRDWYDMTYDQQRAWEREDRRHQEDLYDAEQREREAREEADAADRRRRRELSAVREEVSCLSDDLDAARQSLDQAHAELDALQRNGRALDQVLEGVADFLEALVASQGEYDEAATRQQLAQVRQALGGPS